MKSSNIVDENSFLGNKICDKNAILDSSQLACNLCPRQCGVDRQTKIGYCKSRGLRIARYGLHMWEEPCISGTEGSGTIFFSGCSLRCIYCQNYEVSQLSKGKDITVLELVNIFKQLEEMGANNINLVTPTHYVPQIMMALEEYRPHIPICYNTSGYENVMTIKKLDGYVDVFLTDFKYAQKDLAQEFSRAEDYPEAVKAAIMQMRENIPKDEFDDRGIMTKGLIVRHLVLPGCVQNSKQVLEWTKEYLGEDTILSIMSQYTPYGKAVGHNKIGRKLKPLEYKMVVNYAQKLGFENAYVQQEESADECFIPQFFGDTNV